VKGGAAGGSFCGLIAMKFARIYYFEPSDQTADNDRSNALVKCTHKQLKREACNMDAPNKRPNLLG
jgi:hypothetical protein